MVAVGMVDITIITIIPVLHIIVAPDVREAAIMAQDIIIILVEDIQQMAVILRVHPVQVVRLMETQVQQDLQVAQHIMVHRAVMAVLHITEVHHVHLLVLHITVRQVVIHVRRIMEVLRVRLQGLHIMVRRAEHLLVLRVM